MWRRVKLNCCVLILGNEKWRRVKLNCDILIPGSVHGEGLN